MGAGVVGLAVGRALAKRGCETLIVERHASVGQGISSRNSEVIHAGLYYGKAPLKRELCVQGKRMLYEYCAERHVPHARCGKLIVGDATALRSVQREANRARVPVELLSGDEARSLEPELRCEAALLSPTTGIVDSHALMEALQADAENDGALVILRSNVDGVRLADDAVHLAIDGEELECGVVVNAAGLDAAALLGLVGDAPAMSFAKGNYFSCRTRPFSRLVYPLPEPGGLGIHATVALDGAVRFGPDVEWVEQSDDLDVDERRATRFYESIRRYYPGLRDGDLLPDYAGIRPKIPQQDFVIHTVGRFISLLGIESPGLTAALALAEKVSIRALSLTSTS